MTSVKAKLSILLKADEVVVAEVEDAQLWQRVLTAINAGQSDLASAPRASEVLVGVAAPSSGRESAQNGEVGNGPVDRLAQQLGVARELLEGACSPSADAPYMHLDSHCWEDMKRQLPERGPTAIAPIVAAATLLALWFRAASLGNPTQAQAQAVLDTIGVRDRNASRGIGRASWLQSRGGGQVQLNPAQISRATTLARCFCARNWADWQQSGTE